MSNTGFSTYVCLFLAGCFCYSNASPELSREAVNDRPVIGKSNVNREIERRLRETNILKYRANDTVSLWLLISFPTVCSQLLCFCPAGILTQIVSDEVMKPFGRTYIPASYVKYMESGGSRVMPIR